MSSPNLNGKEIALSDFKNKKVLLIFPRGKVSDDYWCSLCHLQYSELAKLEIDKNLRKKYNLEIIFILPYIKDTVDRWMKYMPKAMATIEKWKNPDDPDNEKLKKWAETVKKINPETITYKDGKFPFPFPILIDADHSLSSTLDIYRTDWNGGSTGQNIPAVFILDENGVVKFKYISQNTMDRPHAEYLAEVIEKLM